MRSEFSEIKIIEPCSEDWAKMTPDVKGKHCAKCEKVVVDFTLMSDTMMLAYLKQYPNSCGRFYNHQLNHEIPLIGTESAGIKIIRRVTMAGIFLSQLWSKKAIAQDINTDSLHNPDPINQPIKIAQYVFQKTVSGRVIQPDSSLYKALKLRFTIDTFCMAFELTNSNVFSFQLPQGFEKNVIGVELFTCDTVYYLKNISLTESGSSFQLNSSRNELIFQFNDSWSCQRVFYNDFPPTTMGIWVDNRMIFDTTFKLRQFMPDSSLIKLVYTTLGFASPSGLNDDSLYKNGLKRAKNLYHLKRKKNKTSVWWWLLLPVSLLLILVKWVSKKDEAIIMNEIEADINNE